MSDKAWSPTYTKSVNGVDRIGINGRFTGDESFEVNIEMQPMVWRAVRTAWEIFIARHDDLFLLAAQHDYVPFCDDMHLPYIWTAECTVEMQRIAEDILASDEPWCAIDCLWAVAMSDAMQPICDKFEYHFVSLAPDSQDARYWGDKLSDIYNVLPLENYTDLHAFNVVEAMLVRQMSKLREVLLVGIQRYYSYDILDTFLM